MPQLITSTPLPSMPSAWPEPAAATRLDEAALRRLRELDPSGENHVVERVLRAFESSLRRLLAQAAQARTQGDPAALRHVAHTLKSSSASVGALVLAQHCSDIENRLRLKQDGCFEASLDALQHEGARVLAAVRDLLAD